MASVEAFKQLGICEQLAEAAAALGWKEPTSIQQQAVPLLLQGVCCHLIAPVSSACVASFSIQSLCCSKLHMLLPQHEIRPLS